MCNLRFLWLTIATVVVTSAAANERPDLGDQVMIFDPAMPAAAIQSRVDELFRQQESAEFGTGRYALLFKPGIYHLDLRVGFYTQVLGLGGSPDDVTIIGHVSADAKWAHGNATVNFWRSVENLCLVPEGGVEKWAVSQACPLRRVHIKGDLALDDHGWSSGGFLADAWIEGTVRSGNQQQWLTRSSRIGGWNGSNWNMVFVGVDGAPAETFPQPPDVNVARATRVVEKPFLGLDQTGHWGVWVPALKREAQGVDWAEEARTARFCPIESFYLASPSRDTSDSLNRALAAGQNLLFAPGTYRLDAALRIERADTVMLGLGLATLRPVRGNAAIEAADLSGVRLAGLLIEAGEAKSNFLIHFGAATSHARHTENPSALSDVFFRVGGASIGKADTCLSIDSADVIGDDLWIWRADHGGGVGWEKNEAAHGLVVASQGVIVYGLAVEHFQQAQTLWRGEAGQVYFYQSEEPYDVPTQAAWSTGSMLGYPSYQVSENVKSHQAWGLGVYCFFHHTPSIKLTSAIVAPIGPGVIFHDVTTISLGGGVGEITHAVNDAGEAAKPGHIRATLVAYPPR